MHFKHFAQKSTFVSWCFQTYHGFKENISHELNINASCCDNFVMPPFVFEVMLAVTDFILKLKHPLYFCCCCCCCLPWVILERFEISDKKNKTWLPSYRPAQMSVTWSFFPIHIQEVYGMNWNVLSYDGCYVFFPLTLPHIHAYVFTVDYMNAQHSSSWNDGWITASAFYRLWINESK